jgi:predicted HTH transcriptional regulator
MSYSKEKLIEITKKIYRLTSLFPKKEPLRYKIREIADEILYSLLKGFQNPTFQELEILDSFFEIAKEQNWISYKEILEIQKEYQEIGNYLKSEFSVKNFSNDQTSSIQLRFHLSDRQAKILEILKEKEKIQVGQIKEFFPNVSKRTLRRDFQNLVKKGIIERIGEKNKTFYKLKNG